MEMRHLVLLREIAVRGTLSAVAAATHRTPSALSQQLRTAERELGMALVEPVGRGLRLTAEGQLLADAADEVCQVHAEVQARLDASRGEPRGTVSIGTLPSGGQALLPPLVEALRGSAIELRLHDFDLAEADYAARTLDVDIVLAHSMSGDVPHGADRLTFRALAREPLDVALPATHPLAGRQELGPQDLVGTRWIGVPEGYPFDTVLLAIEAVTGRPLVRDQRLRDNALIRSLVGAGVGLALLPRFTTPADGPVVLRPLVGVPARRTFYALCRPDRHARFAVRTVVDELARIGASLS
ncbi:LysR family transcriptional regulator [Ornithinimicrobium sp. LYQ92]|uniref:LysR family transcriptional regulator n=1 Tax=Serinicoccus sp. LYQ92 TaxID=3378798 RepID=UPI00385385F6